MVGKTFSNGYATVKIDWDGMYTNGNRVMSGAPQVVCFSSDAALVKISLIPSGSVDITVISSQVEIIDGTGDVFLCEIEITIRLMRKI